MPQNLNLNAAKRGKKDEFYTQLRDIENVCITIGTISEIKLSIAIVMIRD